MMSSFTGKFYNPLAVCSQAEQMKGIGAMSTNTAISRLGLLPQKVMMVYYSL